MAITLIKGGTVVSSTGRSKQDVLIDGQTIAAVLDPSDTSLAADLTERADTVVDATGKYVIPGGIDAHTHMEMPFGGTFASDTFETGTRAAAWGGTTTIIDFAVQNKGGSVKDAIEQWHQKAAGECAIDYAFHQILGDINEQSLIDLRSLAAEGVTSFKMFTAYPGVFYSTDDQIFRAMQVAAEEGLLPMMHAENGPVIDVIAEQLVKEGKTSPYYHGIARPWEMEEEATHRTIMLSRVAHSPVYIVHVTAKQAMRQVQAARADGHLVFGESCPQYLYQSLEEQLGAPGFEGAKYVCSPPLRSKEEGHQEDLWMALRTDALSVVATDHCPFCMKQKQMGANDFRKIPNGMGLVEHRMDLMYQGTVNGRISLERFVDITSTGPARIFGLYGRKGVIAPGADGDVVVYDPNGSTTIGINDTHHMNLDYSNFEGWHIDGHVDTVLSRGKVVVDETGYVGTKGDGEFVACKPSQMIG
ncbi:dihydropyrimidinase [Acidipropionibacterium jensenii]|uniref:dihydropyrimidinase n=1 Tax=Acidipropionibacterium jensenii TaxID=1749 RepID=UPI00214CF46A|nr:dihydropyrimidinase [Acidipropionibacterium jensenii]